jgi:predicted nuclease of restriction endonuclease-like RecB superfamily
VLTSDLVRVKLAKGGVQPSFVDVDREDLAEVAAGVAAALTDGVGSRRADLDEAVDAVLVGRRDAKLVRGVAKILLDRAEFAVPDDVDPPALRDAVFRRARARGGVALAAGPLGQPVAADVIAEVAAELGRTPDAVAEGLYADLPAEQRLVRFDPIEPRAALCRYNVALAQSILLHAVEVRVLLDDPPVPRLRQLLRWAKWFELMHLAERVGKKVLLRLDGPGSVLTQSTRYGRGLAGFFPALLLFDGSWTLDATIRWNRADRTLSLSSEDGLESHLPDTGAWKSRTHEWFEERFAATPSDWTLDTDVLPLDLGGRGVVLPDYRLVRDGRVALVEIVGFWRKEYLLRRLDGLARHGPGNLILAVNRKLGEKADLDGLPLEVVPFGTAVPVKDVLAAAERVAR